MPVNENAPNNRRTFIKAATWLTSAFSLSPEFLQAKNNTRTVAYTEQTIYLWKENSPNDNAGSENRSKLDILIPEGKADTRRAAIIVCPGGGYRRLAPHEGKPFAELFAANGMVGCVLKYRHHPHKHPAPYADACRALRLLRKNADKYNIDPNRIGLMGFSAGGHLASTVATQPDLYKDLQDDLASTVSARPDRVILGYPVISFLEHAHQGSVQTLLGDNPDKAMLEQLSNARHVTSQSPPAFLFHTAEDPAVPVQNSLQFADACVQHKIPVALHVFPKGRHGVGMAADNPSLKIWPTLLLDWLQDWKA